MADSVDQASQDVAKTDESELQDPASPTFEPTHSGKAKHKVRIQKKNGRYYFQHPYARLFVAYFVIFCNFLIYAEDPVSHSRANCTIPVVGNDFAFVTYRYPPGGWSVLKVFMWLAAIVVGLLVGKFFFHKLVFNRWMRLTMFKRDSGSWMVMFLTTLVSLFIFSFIYNGFLSAGGDELSLYHVTSYLGIQNDSFMKAAGLGTWMGDFVTAWMVTDMMLQDKLYPDWNKRLRKIWRTGWTRIYMFWIVLVIATAIVATGIISDFVRWDTLNRDFVSTNELSRAFLASFILVMDLLIVMQDKLTEEQIEEYRDAFKFFDKDGNGYITTRELGAIMRSLGQNPTETELQDMVNEVDYDGNGVVDFGEFVNMMINQNNNTLDEKELLEAFRTFDGDDKGYIFSNEIRYVMRHMGESIPEQDINEILQDHEDSRKRKITFEEFIKLVKPEV
ncbi:LOW QUALITY PROTEIN: transmembrane protein 117-like [Oculina patagonica]